VRCDPADRRVLPFKEPIFPMESPGSLTAPPELRRGGPGREPREVPLLRSGSDCSLIGAPQGHRDAGERDPDYAPGSAEEDVYRRVAPSRIQGRVE
jgi:hypothetical protein